MNNIKHPKKALTAATAKSKKPAPTHTVAPGINVSDKVYSFPGRDLLAVRITSEGAILDALNRAISEEYRQLSNGVYHLLSHFVTVVSFVAALRYAFHQKR